MDTAHKKEIKSVATSKNANGANAIIALRSSLLSGRFDDFWVRYRANNCPSTLQKNLIAIYLLIKLPHKPQITFFNLLI